MGILTIIAFPCSFLLLSYFFDSFLLTWQYEACYKGITRYQDFFFNTTTTSHFSSIIFNGKYWKSFIFFASYIVWNCSSFRIYWQIEFLSFLLDLSVSLPINSFGFLWRLISFDGHQRHQALSRWSFYWSPWLTGLVCSGSSLTSWGKGAFLALVDHSSTDSVMIKMPYLCFTSTSFTPHLFLLDWLKLLDQLKLAEGDGRWW